MLKLDRVSSENSNYSNNTFTNAYQTISYSKKLSQIIWINTLFWHFMVLFV